MNRGVRTRVPEAPLPGPTAPAERFLLGSATPRGIGVRPHLSPSAAAAFATYVDSARARAAIEGRTLVYTVRWA
ncbi:MAG: hypothetical protein L3K07_03365 [Thermoplasmata archaeon]|nr:hypothetical protein [Thermoplasmata archaeon]